IERGWLGVFIKEENGEIIVSDLVDDGPAEKYGIKKGDIIIKYNKKDVQDIQSFIKTVKETKPGRKVQIAVKRGKKKVNIDVIIDERPEENKLYKFKEIIPPLKFFYEKDELKQLKEEIEKLKKELEKQKKN
ncbi:PDZ domain-containing protein, partial [candidate division WOR-3 bacterium]|nr:PDZ domain-containing protein [candidate division WOR-3 bacterium]